MMISALVLIAAAMSVAGASGLAFETGRRRGALAAKQPLEERLGEVERLRNTADENVKVLRSEVDWLRNLGLSSHTLSDRPVFHNRVAPRDVEELSALVRGLTLVDDVVIADAHGWPQSRETNLQSADLCAIVPALQQVVARLAERGLQVLALDLETTGAQHVHARPLLGRAEGTTLLVRTTSQPVARSVPDAVAHAASRASTDVPAAPPAFKAITERGDVSGASSGLTTLLDRELASSALAVAVTVGGRALYSASHDGPDALARSGAASALDAFSTAASHTLRSTVVRMHVSVAGAYTLSWAALDTEAGGSLLTFGRADERTGARLDRLLGSVRRSLGEPAAILLESQGAA